MVILNHIWLTVKATIGESMETVSVPFLSCHLLTLPLLGGFMCTRYGFNSHGLSVVEHRLRARQQKQAELTAGTVSCCGRVFLPLKEMGGNMERARGLSNTQSSSGASHAGLSTLHHSLKGPN